MTTSSQRRHSELGKMANPTSWDVPAKFDYSGKTVNVTFHVDAANFNDAKNQVVQIVNDIMDADILDVDES